MRKKGAKNKKNIELLKKFLEQKKEVAKNADVKQHK